MYRPSVRLDVHRLEDRSNPSTAFLATNLVSDQPGVAQFTDPTLVNAWGISLNPSGGGFWISSNGNNLSEVYAGNVNGSAIAQPFKVGIPGGAPTDQVFNNSGSTTDFSVTDGTTTKPAVFIFASEAGQITGWSPTVGGAAPSKTAEVGFTATDGAVYKGLAIGQVGGANFLYATDFHNGKIDVINGQFQKVTLGSGGFESFADPNLPTGYAPFGIASVGGKLYVSYALQKPGAHDDQAGPHHGFIDVFEMNGHLDKRLVSGGDLNSPWGMVKAPAGFGDFGNDLLVGNFGDGHIHAFDPTSGKEMGTLGASPMRPLVIEGLWGLAFGNGIAAGDANALYFAAGPAEETHGLFGKITANAAGTNPVTVKQTGDDLAITGGRDNDRISVKMDEKTDKINVISDGQQIGQFDATTVGTIHFNGLAGNDVFTVDPHVTATVIASAGAGNDLLQGGGGNNILIGGSGNDVLIGGMGRNILIGGSGKAKLYSSKPPMMGPMGWMGGTTSGDTILIAGSTAYDSDPASLLQILGVWTGTGSYATRVAAIRAGTGGVPKLDATTVTDSAAADLLVGGRGLDWFFGATPPDTILGKRPGEQMN